MATSDALDEASEWRGSKGHTTKKVVAGIRLFAQPIFFGL